MMELGFSGSYRRTDIQFLLRPGQLEFTDLAEKERLIQSGQRHYSEMLSEEAAPSALQLELFEQAIARGGQRMARDIQALAQALAQQRPGRPLVLLSLVRAGVPIGVLLHRALADLAVESHHYGISIIRDKGLDRAALAAIIERHACDDLVFVDGWTGKGAISQELRRSLQSDPRFSLPIRLLTLADVAGKAWLAASNEDWLIPSGMLGATVSGLVSRSVLSRDQGWHWCLDCQHLSAQDQSQSFIERINRLRQQLGPVATAVWSDSQRQQQADWADACIAELVQRYQVQNLNRLKPGIAEATRALLRRLPERILVRDPSDPDVAMLVHLAQQRAVPVVTLAEQLGPYRAITLIKQVL